MVELRPLLLSERIPNGISWIVKINHVKNYKFFGILKTNIIWLKALMHGIKNQRYRTELEKEQNVF